MKVGYPYSDLIVNQYQKIWLTLYESALKLISIFLSLQLILEMLMLSDLGYMLLKWYDFVASL